MDTNRDKIERPYVVPYEPLATVHPVAKPETSRSRKVKILLVLLTAAATFGLNHCWRGVDSDLPNSTPSTQVDEPEFDWNALEPAKTIKWTPCYSGQKCARLLLPLDYGTPDGPTTAIALRILPATDNVNYKGPVLINPGGPGGSGTNLVARAGKNISAIVGPSFDILGFDPRGIGASTPSASCFESDSQRQLWSLQEGHRLLNASDDSVDIARARQILLGQRCEQKIGGEWGIARFMSTLDVARDVLEISQQLGHEKLQYWGFSYGSILGQYFSAIYPDKVGRVIIDGIYDGHNYRGALWNSNLADTDAVIDAFFTFCHQAGPDKCALYDSTPAKIRARFFGVLRSLEAQPVSIPSAEPPVLVTRKVLQSQLFQATYKPLAQFGILADTVYALESGNQTALTALAPKIVPPTECKCADPEPWLASNEAFSPIACGDADETVYDRNAYAKYYEGLAASSQLVAPLWANSYLKCAEWRVRPKWRWTGPLGAKNTSHPLLLVSPRYDPICPLSDAQAVQERYGGSGLLIQESVGHCTLAAPSLCTAKHIRAYMENGTLPAAGVVCGVDELPFVGAVQDVRALSVEDAELLEALKGLSTIVPTFGFGGL